MKCTVLLVCVRLLHAPCHNSNKINHTYLHVCGAFQTSWYKNLVLCVRTQVKNRVQAYWKMTQISWTPIQVSWCSHWQLLNATMKYWIKCSCVVLIAHAFSAHRGVRNEIGCFGLCPVKCEFRSETNQWRCHLPTIQPWWDLCFIAQLFS